MSEETTQQFVEHHDLNEHDKIMIMSLNFYNFKGKFEFKKMQLNETIKILLVVRQFLENTMSVNYHQIKDCHKKHCWLGQKINDFLKVNSALVFKQQMEILEKSKEEKTNKAESDDVFYSNANWTKIGYTNDRHSSEGFSNAMCEALLKNWGVGKPPCEIRGNCLKAWTTKGKPDDKKI